MERLKTLILVTRPWSFIMTIIVSASAAAYSAYLGLGVDYVLTLAAVIGLVLLHASVNVINDYFDTVRGVDRPGTGTTEYRPHPIVHNILTPNATLAYGLALGFTALAIGALISLAGRPYAILIGLAGTLLGWGYTATPIAFKYRALGELAVILAFGPLMFLGVFYVASGVIDWRAVAVSLPLGIMIAAVLLANNIRDIDSDREAGVKTIAVILGRERSLALYKAMLIASYILVAVMAVAGILPLTTLLTLITLPAALKLAREAEARGPPVDFDPQTAKLVTQFGGLLAVSIAAYLAVERLAAALAVRRE